MTVIHEGMRDFLSVNSDFFQISQTLQAEKIVELLDKKQIESVLPDREPFLIIEKAVIFKDNRGRLCGLTVSEISEKECAGHLERKLMAPLIMFSRALALSGRLLSACISDREKSIPEVLATGKVKSLIPSLPDMKYTIPPVKVLSFVRVHKPAWLGFLSIFSPSLKKKMKKLIVIDSQCWIVSEGKLIPAGSIKKLEYYLIRTEVLYAALSGALAKKPA